MEAKDMLIPRPIMEGDNAYERRVRQTKISFKAGLEEVVGWIDEHSRMTYEHGKGEIAFNHVEWHTKLKEWGIEL